jgi:hypothetical protein
VAKGAGLRVRSLRLFSGPEGINQMAELLRRPLVATLATYRKHFADEYATDG